MCFCSREISSLGVYGHAGIELSIVHEEKYTHSWRHRKVLVLESAIENEVLPEASFRSLARLAHVLGFTLSLWREQQKRQNPNT